jgi:hypothetical protein
MKKSKYSFSEWIASISETELAGKAKIPGDLTHAARCGYGVERIPMRRVHRVPLGTAIEFESGASYFGSGGYSGTAVWAGEEGRCPLVIEEKKFDDGFSHGTEGSVKFVHPGVLYLEEHDCIGGGRSFRNDIYVCEG